eukprot:snap_masked-scaffold_4-processed-gene-11.28-mRNA-1 protein AED:1.00 eAED:1.00 QI:0/-1/0/0/-1/1/1/0/368
MVEVTQRNESNLLKHSCRECSFQKRKCDGKKPSCARCIRLSRSCTYDYQKRRGRKRKERELNQILGSRKAFSINKFGAACKNSIATFFFMSALETKNYLSDEVVQFDVGRHLLAFKNHSLVSGSNIFGAEASHLNNILLSIKYSKFVKGVESREITWDDWKRFSLFDERLGGLYNKDIKLSEGIARNIMLPMRTIRVTEEFPLMRTRSDVSTLNNPQERYFVAEVNKPFQRIFGLSANDIMTKLSNSLVGFLPFGTGIISLIAPEQELRKYMEIHCLKAKYLKAPKSAPWVWETFDISPMNLFINSGRPGETSTFLLTSVIRYLNGKDSVFEEVYIYPKPIDKLPEIPQLELNVSENFLSISVLEDFL